MFVKPDHITDDNWKGMADAQRLVESKAHELLSGPCKEFICVDTLLISDCLKSDLMSFSEVINYPQPDNWTAEQCQEWCMNNGIDICSEFQECDRTCLMTWLEDVIQFGESELNTDLLRKILLNRLDDLGDQGLTLWRSIVRSRCPDIYEWWSIEESLAVDLIEMGCFVLKNKYGCWWGRQSTGMHVLLDGTLQAVARKRIS